MKPTWFKTFFTLSPFKVGCLVVLAAAAYFYSFGQQKPPLLAALDNRVTDAMFRWRGPMPTAGQVVIVDIDEKSLRQVGQWPWPRHTVAKLIRQVGSVQPKAIGLDIVFAEADRTSPKNFLDELQLHLPNTISASQLESVHPETALSYEGKERWRRKSGAYTRYVSIFRRPSNAAIGRKGRFRMGTTYTIIVVGGLVLAALLSHTTALAGGLGGILLIEATVVGNYYLFFKQNELVGVVYPLATVVLIFMVVTLFNYFYEGRERRFISKAFGRYVSPRIVERLSKNPEKLSLKGEQKVLTVLFSDIRGFTSISEKMPPEVLGQFMNEYLTAMSDIIMAHNGTVDKYIGDAIMAIWGAPLTDEEHAVNCVRTAFGMIAKLNKLDSQWEKRGLPRINIGIGINSGWMSVGNFGSEQRFDYTVMGDSVNLASRLEGSNKTYGTNIIISEYTREMLGDRFFCRFIDMVRVKGKALPVKIYEPICEGKPDPRTRKSVEEFEQAMAYYRIRRFDEAEDILAALQATTPAKIYDLYLERITHFREDPPCADWDGAFTFITK